jgi:hypothetical protein
MKLMKSGSLNNAEVSSLLYLERILFMLRRSEVEEIVCNQVGEKPEKNDHRVSDKAGAVVHPGKERDQKNPESQVIYRPDHG